MHALDKILRGRLEKIVKEAREIAESAARAALEQLGVGDAEPFDYLSEDERALRRRLRLHGRGLGDTLHGDKTQGMARLIEEVAYEHWHRMLFARFLAENNLLMYPDPTDPVAVSLEECDDLAADEGAANGWELAARYAAEMLPQIFRVDSPVFALSLPPEHQKKMEDLVAGLSQDVFTASDSLGWVYQFWQAKRKDEVNASEVKIGARELPAVTQLFTEPYMVSHLLDNSLGAWWAARVLDKADLKGAQSEEELREKAAIPGVPLSYLRFVRDEEAEGSPWMPAAGTFDAWPSELQDLKALDPCCGSGHFMVASFLMLVPMRMELEELSPQEAVDAVLRDNIHGLELDQRCVELAAFALALAAWTYPGAGGYHELPPLTLACSGLSVHVEKEEWKTIAKALPGKGYLPIALEWMYEAYKKAPVLGSLLDPTRAKVAERVPWHEIGPAIKEVLANGHPDALKESGVVAQGLSMTTHILTEKYHWVLTNVPYLARGKQEPCLQDFCAKYYPEAKNDLSTVFLDRCLELCEEGGTASIVLPQNWLFLTNYRKFREKLLKHDTWHMICRLGPGAFETISGEVVKAILLTLSHGNGRKAWEGQGALFADASREDESYRWIRGLDVSVPRTAVEKASRLVVDEIKCVEQANQLENYAFVIKIDDDNGLQLLASSADCYLGICTGDMHRFATMFWEQKNISKNWRFFRSTSQKTKHWGGMEKVVFWENGCGELHSFVEEKLGQGKTGAWIRGKKCWGNEGVAVKQMGTLPVSLYNGELFDDNVAVIIPEKMDDLTAVYAFCSSNKFNDEVRKVNQKLAVKAKYFLQAEYDLSYWTQVAAEKYPNGLPQQYSNDPTQWIFHGHPCGSVIWDEADKCTADGPLRTDETVLQVAVARLLGYRWPAEMDAEMELDEEQRDWANNCEELLPLADEDGIVCIPPVRGEASAADRLLGLLAAAYDESWTHETLATLLANSIHAEKTLDTWLRDKFFTQHCKMFQHRPFIWQVWDGLKDGFSALVNYHKLDYKNLETLIYTYLGDWITRQKQEIEAGVDGAQEKLAAAQQLKCKLEKILEGEAPYDIFVRWKPLDKQPVGWNPDLNDGVRLNIRPFMLAGDVKKKGAGVLRDKPNVKWGKDRGKDVTSAPWFHMFGGDRINDHHVSLTEKQAAKGVQE